jgi:hypothetical protein
MMLAALALGISTAAAAAAPKVLPGEWETTSQYAAASRADDE